MAEKARSHRSIFLLVCLVTALFAAGTRLYADEIAYAAAYNTSTTSIFGTLDVDTGAFTQIVTLDNIFVNDLALSPTGTLYILTSSLNGGSSELATIDTGTGAITDIATNSIGLNSIAFGPDGTLYGTTYNAGSPDAVYTIDPATGVDMFVTDLQGTLATEAGDIRFLGDTAYTTTFDFNDPTAPADLYSVNLSTGSGTLIGSTGISGVYLTGVENGELVGGDDSSGAIFGSAEILTIDPGSGAVVAQVPTDLTYNFIATSPEPTTVLLLAGGLALLFARSRSLRASRTAPLRFPYFPGLMFRNGRSCWLI